MAREKVIIDPILLRKLYIEDNVSASQLAIRFNCTRRTITIKLERYGIPIRSVEEAHAARDFRHTPEERLKMSRACRRGPNHPNWKGGKVSANKQVRFSVEYQLWREAVYQRDDWTCQFCGKRGGYLEADHIKAFADHVSLRFEVSNGRTLCHKCHRWATGEQQRQPKRSRATCVAFIADSPHQ